jgi:hypothetical protein
LCDLDVIFWAVCVPREGYMPGDPKECREHAANCYVLAAQATSPSAKKIFTDLAEHWERLAAELESAQTFLRVMAEIPLKEPSGPSDAQKT